ncbi:MAG: 30S ribosomal protein S6 [bacterium]
METRLYELLIAVDPGLPAADAEALLTRINQTVTAASGTVRNTEKAGVRSLAYKVKGKREANFLVLTVEAPTSLVPAIEGFLRLHEGVLRYMTTRIQPTQVAASSAPQAAPAPAPAAG